jgi:signal transduction histidine kinase
MVISGRCELEKGWLEVSISDTGEGIDPDKLQHIFEPFFSTKETGTGLGLWISHSIVAAHDGQLIVESILGAGTCVSVRLPLKKVEVMQ